MRKDATADRQMDWPGGDTFVDEFRRILYVSTPKVACSSIKTMLRNLVTETPLKFNPLARETSLAMLVHDREQIPLPSLTAFSGEQLRQIVSGPGWFRFCIIRHPYDRFFSTWRDKIFITEPGFEAYIPDDGRKFVEFGDFLTQVMSADDPGTCDRHWRSQVSLLAPDMIAYTRIYDLTEIPDLRNDLQEHLTSIGISQIVPPLPKLNQSWSISSDGFLTPDVRFQLQQFYRDDFTRFNFVDRPDTGHPPAKASDFVNEFSDAVFERNRLIAEYHHYAQRVAGKGRHSRKLTNAILKPIRSLRRVFKVLT